MLKVKVMEPKKSAAPIMNKPCEHMLELKTSRIILPLCKKPDDHDCKQSVASMIFGINTRFCKMLPKNEGLNVEKCV